MIASQSPEILYWHVDRNADGKIQGEARRAVLNFDLSAGTLLRLLLTPSKNLEIQKRVADHFTGMNSAPETIEYIRAFFTRLVRTCEVDTPDLRIRAEEQGCEMDFPRSSASWMMMREFCGHLRAHAPLAEGLRTFLARWQ